MNVAFCQVSCPYPLWIWDDQNDLSPHRAPHQSPDLTTVETTTAEKTEWRRKPIFLSHFLFRIHFESLSPTLKFNLCLFQKRGNISSIFSVSPLRVFCSSTRGKCDHFFARQNRKLINRGLFDPYADLSQKLIWPWRCGDSKWSGRRCRARADI